MSELARWLQNALDNRPYLNQTSVARKINVSTASVSNWMHGITPSYEHCLKLAAFFDVPPTTVLEMAGYITPTPVVIRDGDPPTYLTPDQRDLLRLYASLPPDDQHRILAIMRTFQNLPNE